MLYVIDIGIAYVLDLLIGDPENIPHPVRFICWLIKVTEAFLRDKIVVRFDNKAKAERISGFLLCGIVVVVTSLIVFLILFTAKQINQILFHVINTYIIFTAIATKCLSDEAKKVYDRLENGTLEEARERLSWLVGRDTRNLSEEAVIRGVIETTAENTVDGVVSPLFYAFLGSIFGLGAPLVYAFKAVSTLDSMVGYKNDKYRYLGTASARLDDILNFIPARLTVLIIAAASTILGNDGLRSLRTAMRDRKKHLSPNSAHGESAVAGALGIRLGGPNVYFGKVVEKPYIGDDINKTNKYHIKQTVKIMYMTSLLAVIIFMSAAIFLVL